MAQVSTSAENTPIASMTEAATPYTRLHITPFDQSLQSVVIPASILPRARNISYHTLETFPEKRFGFVDLPTMDADKLKKKLNGAVLKGSKVRIETARPDSIPEPTSDVDTVETKKEKKEKKKSKKRKHEINVIDGVELHGRKVKRGWTTTEQEMIEEKRKKSKKDKREATSKDDKKDKKKKKRNVKSKYTDEPECLFKTKLPDASLPKEHDEDTSAPKKKRKRQSGREVIVHEFEKTVKHPSFLKASSTTGSAEAAVFKDGVGWVDSAGNVVEPVQSKRRPEGIPAPDPPKPKRAAPAPQEDEDDDETSSSGSSSSDEDEDSSSSDQDSDVSAEQTEIGAPVRQLQVETQNLSSPITTKVEVTRPKSSGSITSLSIKIPPVTPATKKVHPLEALYKRPPGGSNPPDGSSEAQPFSFFDKEDDDRDEETSLAPASQAPMTPFTKQDFDFRNVRSAAPTPDTAHPSRSFNFWARQDSTDDAVLEEDGVEGLENVEEEEEEGAEDEDMNMDDSTMEDAAAGETSQAPVSDFQKQFWESRGNLNRAWRKRRKLASKEKRYRENRARAERAI
ncbi:hypothetical protein F5Y19DRAFT_437321 [Xylariaceae sp. FL1651]|nr:hypothetical protein F5Y19DRAFT_437321 [Xylariaceae sp. FL1651]